LPNKYSLDFTGVFATNVVATEEQIGLMHLAIFLWGIPYYSQSLDLGKVGFPSMKIDQNGSFGILNVEQYLFSLGGFPLLRLFINRFLGGYPNKLLNA